MFAILRMVFRLSKGYRLHFWDSPYLKWRVETWSGLEAESLTPQKFLQFTWQHRAELLRYMRWAANRGIAK